MSAEKPEWQAGFLPLLYVPHRSLDVFWNFGLESYFVQEKRLQDRAVFLFWRTYPTLMLGRFQNAMAEINRDYVKQHGLNLVRRKSGGGTIYTDEGSFQYSFIQPQSSDLIEFRHFIQPVLAALNSLGIPAEFNGRNDLVVGGKKFSGAAQYKEKGFVVHHGSILFDTDINAMVESTTVPEYKLIDKGIRSVRERVINLKEALPPESADLTVEGFERYMLDYLCHREDGAALESYILSPQEEARAAILADRFYRHAENFWQKNPDFDQILEKKFPAGLVRLSLNVHQGYIQEAKIEGDFFANFSAEEFASILKGALYEETAIMERFLATGLADKLYRTKIQDFVHFIVSGN